MLAEALSLLIMNTANVSLDEYKRVIEHQPKVKIERQKKSTLFLTDEQKKYFNDFSQLEITRIIMYKEYHEKVFKDNFDRWEIKEAGQLYPLLQFMIKKDNKLSLLWAKEAKFIKKYPSISTKNKEISNIYQEIADITKLYLQRAKEADEVSKFMDTFLLANQEVLEALA